VAELVVTAAGSRPASRPGAAVPVSYNVQPFVPPFAMQFPRNVTVTVEIVPVSKDVGGESEGDADAVQLLVRSSGSTGAALFVVLTTHAPGRFSENAFLLESGPAGKSVSFLSWTTLSKDVVSLLRSTLRVEHMAQYIC
jgi:hypothetical protein